MIRILEVEKSAGRTDLIIIILYSRHVTSRHVTILRPEIVLRLENIPHAIWTMVPRVGINFDPLSEDIQDSICTLCMLHCQFY